jgi:gentisate 1,2-dioxygenase
MMSDNTGNAGVMETPEREAFYERIGRKNLAPLWTSLNNLITREPRSKCVPASWRFGDVRAAMMEAGGIISAKEAERRVLVLENPGLPGESKIQPICMLACNWSFPARLRLRTVTRKQPCAL